MRQRLAALAGAFLLALWAGAASADYPSKPAIAFADPTGMALLDITYCEGRLFAVGERGLIMYSDDYGVAWTAVQAPVSQSLTAVACGDAGSIFAAGHGGVILGSKDRGESWTLQFDGNEANRRWLAYQRARVGQLEEAVAAAAEDELDDLEYALEDAEFAVEDAEAALEAGPVDPFLDIWFRDGQSGFAVGAYGMLYRTENGGASWELAVEHIDNPDRYHYYAMAADGVGNLFLSGEAGLLYRSVDNGRHWERLDPGYDGSLFGVVITGDDAVLAFGLRGNVLLSEDAGETWVSVPVNDDPEQGLHGGTRLIDDTIVLVGSGGVVLTSKDNGRSFTSSLVSGAATQSAVAGGARNELLVVGMEGVIVYEVGADD